jgi:hypothetical protein
MTPADTRALAAALLQIERDMLDFGLQLELDDAGMIALHRFWRGHVARLFDAHPSLPRRWATPLTRRGVKMGSKFLGQRVGGSIARPSQRRSSRRSESANLAVLPRLQKGDRVRWGADPISIGRTGIVERILPADMVDVTEDGTDGRRVWRLRLSDLAR